MILYGANHDFALRQVKAAAAAAHDGSSSSARRVGRGHASGASLCGSGWRRASVETASRGLPRGRAWLDWRDRARARGGARGLATLRLGGRGDAAVGPGAGLPDGVRQPRCRRYHQRQAQRCRRGLRGHGERWRSRRRLCRCQLRGVLPGDDQGRRGLQRCIPACRPRL